MRSPEVVTARKARKLWLGQLSWENHVLLIADGHSSSKGEKTDVKFFFDIKSKVTRSKEHQLNDYNGQLSDIPKQSTYGQNSLSRLFVTFAILYFTCVSERPNNEYPDTS